MPLCSEGFLNFRHCPADNENSHMESFFIGAIVGIIISALIGAAIGETKGRRDAGFIFGLLLGPLGWLLIAIGPNYKKEGDGILSGDSSRNSAASQLSDMEALEKLASLREKGVITQEEFDLKKKQILNIGTSTQS